MIGRLTILGLATLASLVGATTVQAEPTPVARYSLPLQLRPAAVVNVVRVDTAHAMFDDMAGGSSTTATMVLGSYKLTPDIAAFVRLGTVRNDPAARARAWSIVNPALGVAYGGRIGRSLRYAAMLATALPLGMGGGNDGDPSRAAGARAAILARSALDNAMFALNDLVLFPGFDLAYVEGNLTVQAEVTLLQLFRVRGDAVQPDELKTNFTTGLHVGYFVTPWISAAGELRYQRWLSTPASVTADPTGASRDALTVSVGARFHLEVAPKTILRPAIAYTRGLDDPMASRDYHIVHVDVPFVF